MYVNPNFKTKKALRKALQNGENVDVINNSLLGSVPVNGTVHLEGPHYPQAHTWYAEGKMRDGKLVSIK
jgi:hypothetical protein